MKLSVVVLTMGNRPVELKKAVDSALSQKGVDVEIILVGNGADVPGSWGDAVRVVRLPENVGIPAGRNRGVEASTGEVILFLDDDGWYESTELGAYLRDRFTADPKLGIVSFRVRDPEGGPGEQPARAPAARGRPAALVGGDDVPGRRLRGAPRGLRRGRMGCRRTSSTPTRRPTSPGRR